MKVTRVNADINPQVYMIFKRRVMMDGHTISSMVRKLVYEYLKKKGENHEENNDANRPICPFLCRGDG